MAVRMQVIGSQHVAPGEYLLVLREIEGRQRYGAIVAGLTEAVQIQSAFLNLTGPRPSAHETWAKTLTTAGIILEQLVIHAIDSDNVAQALLCYRLERRRWTVDCRPSDGIALALRMKAPLMCEEVILDRMEAKFQELNAGAQERSDEEWVEYFKNLGDLPTA